MKFFLDLKVFSDLLLFLQQILKQTNKQRKEMENSKIAAFERARHQTMDQYEEENEITDKNKGTQKPKFDAKINNDVKTKNVSKQRTNKLLISNPSANPFLSDPINEDIDFETILGNMFEHKQTERNEQIQEEEEERDGMEQTSKLNYETKTFKTQNEKEVVTTVVENIDLDDLASQKQRIIKNTQKPQNYKQNHQQQQIYKQNNQHHAKQQQYPAQERTGNNKTQPFMKHRTLQHNNVQRKSLLQSNPNKKKLNLK
jgi:hypothetical protein